MNNYNKEKSRGSGDLPVFFPFLKTIRIAGKGKGRKEKKRTIR